jgi:hypothetical protein
MNYNSERYGFDLIKAKKTYRPKIRKNKNSEKSLVFSKKIVAALEDKTKIHNEKFTKKVTLVELKKAYKSGFNASSDLNKETLAHVNLFLRAAQENIVNFLSHFKAGNFEVVGNEFIIRGSLSPQEVDYKQAQEDIKNYGLEDFDFKSQDELYLEDEEDRVIISDLNNI